MSRTKDDLFVKIRAALQRRGVRLQVERALIELDEALILATPYVHRYGITLERQLPIIERIKEDCLKLDWDSLSPLEIMRARELRLEAQGLAADIREFCVRVQLACGREKDTAEFPLHEVRIQDVRGIMAKH